ncbi:hypothetical protein CGZ80_04640 [Rhodopirellula sp. MGV]|nr:hypothetical protein CGZ80_04640 [Rhodopirellula sp. MGV]
MNLGKALDSLPVNQIPASVRPQTVAIREEVRAFLHSTRWIDELEVPFKRQYHHYSKHTGAHCSGRTGTKMDLTPSEATEVLRKAEFSEKAAANTVPSLWAFKDGKIYRFMRDATESWHGYPTVEAPPTEVLRKWRSSGVITKAAYMKLLQLPQRAK